MSWNYRISVESVQQEDLVLYVANIREVYYSDEGEVVGYTAPIITGADCDTKEQALVELELELKNMLAAFEAPIFVAKED